MTKEHDTLPISPALVGWVIAAFIFSIVAVTFNNAPIVLVAGFFAKTLAVIAGTILGTIGALIGNALRKLAMPDSVFTTGGMMHLLWMRIFWAIGPQMIGLFIGVATGCALVLNF